MALLLISFGLILNEIVKKEFVKSDFTYFVYVAFGLVFESIFLIINERYLKQMVDKYHIIFPILITISLIVRYFNNFKTKLIYFLASTAFLCSFLKYPDFVSLNYIISIFGILFIAIDKIRNNQFRWYYLIDVLIALNLYFMLLTQLLSYKVHFWNGSIYVHYMHYLVSFLLFLTLILINVKFWRSIAH